MYLLFHTYYFLCHVLDSPVWFSVQSLGTQSRYSRPGRPKTGVECLENLHRKALDGLVLTARYRAICSAV